MGHYMAETWNHAESKYIIEDTMHVSVVVSEKESSDIVVNTMAPAEGKFAFTSHHAGDHLICLTPTPSDSHYSAGNAIQAQVRLHLDVIIGEAKPDTSHADKGHVNDLASRVSGLNDRLKDIRKEQQFQREREAQFRDESEKTNARAVIYSAVQGVVLVTACVWQLRTLRVSWSVEPSIDVPFFQVIESLTPNFCCADCFQQGFFSDKKFS